MLLIPGWERGCTGYRLPNMVLSSRMSEECELRGHARCQAHEVTATPAAHGDIGTKSEAFSPNGFFEWGDIPDASSIPPRDSG